jgi:transcription elongation factor GreA
MQVPRRRSEQFRKYSSDGGPVYLTVDGIKQLQEKLVGLETGLPEAIREVERTKEYGDFSENAEYKEAKYKLRQLHSQINRIKNQLKKAVEIKVEKSDRVQIGSTVKIEVNGEPREYQILGSIESNPGEGKISNQSPIGAALLGHRAGDSIKVELKNKVVVYKILEIK